jgi:hypothetical protein
MYNVINGKIKIFKGDSIMLCTLVVQSLSFELTAIIIIIIIIMIVTYS